MSNMPSPVPVEQDFVLRDCEEISKALNQEVEGLKNLFLDSGFLGDRIELLKTLAQRDNELKMLDSLIVLRIMKRNDGQQILKEDLRK